MRVTTARLLVAAVAVVGVGLTFLATGASAPAQEEPEYVGSDFCAECHVDQFEKFQGTIHDDTLAYLEDDLTGIGGCEACHGAGSLHVELAGGEEPGFRAAMDSSPDPDACWQCHLEVRGQFSMPERHPVLQGFMTCADCHDPHGTSNVKFLREAANDTCTSCHADKAGPWVFPHPVSEVEGCTACHQPHGSVNPHMLPYREITFTCLSCHPSTPAFHTIPSFAQCNACHTQIHGSNLDPFFLE